MTNHSITKKLAAIDYKDGTTQTALMMSESYDEGYRDGLSGGDANIKILAQAIAENYQSASERCHFCFYEKGHSEECAVPLAEAVIATGHETREQQAQDAFDRS